MLAFNDFTEFMRAVYLAGKAGEIELTTHSRVMKQAFDLGVAERGEDSDLAAESLSCYKLAA